LPQVVSSGQRRAPVERDTWLLLGNCFIQLPTNDVVDMLTTEQATIEKELETTNAQLKKNVEQLLLLEGLQDEYAGFNLKPMN
jgi:chaperonin cofactor prefoldin